MIISGFSTQLLPISRHNVVLFMLALAVFLAGCQPTVYLMPTPVVLHSGEISAYADKQSDKSTNVVTVFYATNRLPVGLKSDRFYSTGLTDTLRLGQANIRIGDKGESWDILKAFSTTEERDKKLKLSLKKSTELGELKATPGAYATTKETRLFIDAINQALLTNESKDITVYIHGATANFYTAVAQSAQVRHFTGYNHLVLAFSWPTAENFLYYGTDVKNAVNSAPLFARLLQFLAENTEVEKINILAYSAGGQVASPGLVLLDQYMSGLSPERAKKHLRLGEIYFAAPDVDMLTYVEHLPAYSKLVKSTTIALNPEDFVLNLSRIHQGTPRIGRPDATILNERQIQWLTKASNEDRLNVIRILPDILTDHDSGAHDFWFSHPWVSTDVLIQLLFHATPSKRGLNAEYTEQFKWWYFPQEYPDKIVDIVNGFERKAGYPQ